MNDRAHPGPLPELDDPLRRLPGVIITAVAIWIGLLAAFSFLLERAEPPPAELKPIEARIVELPKEVGGLSDGGGAPAHPAAAPAPKPRPAPAHVPPTPEMKVAPPPIPAAPNGTAKSSSVPAPPAAASTGATGGASSGPGPAESGPSSEEKGSDSGPGGVGTDNLGAHAIYAPVPEIPDDLREDAIQTEAVAHFKVTSDGQVTVSLATKTEDPRLNKIILDTLEQWRFFPAMKDGVAIDSEFDLKIPISVQ